MLPETSQLAFKEWAVTQRALAQGQQVLLLGKGGIREEGKDFRVVHPEFLLYPTYEHQREDLLKEGYQASLRQILAEPRQDDQITFTHWVRVEETIEVADQDRVDRLSPHHIWTNGYTQTRLRWKPMSPLSILLLRVYRMGTPVIIPFLPEYRGCTSWVPVSKAVPLGDLTPVLSDEEFQTRVDAIKGCL